jgi:putative endonuclease
VLEVNFRSKVGEIDLVAEDKGTLVFVEVRTKSGRAFGSATESVNYRKRGKLIAVAQTYLAKRGAENRDWRIDVVAVEVDSQDMATVEVLKNAVEA